MTARTTDPLQPLTDDRRFRRLGFLVVLAIFGGLGTWGALAPLESAALAPAVVTVENYRKTVQHLEGGIIRSLRVRDGDSVVKDQVLITLEETQPRSQLEILRGQYFISAAREARLLAQRDGLKQVRYPVELTAAPRDPRAEEAIRVQNQTFTVRMTAHEGEIALYRRQIEQLHAKARGLKAQIASLDRLVASFRQELDDFAALLKEGYTEKQKVRELERSLAQSEGQRGERVSDLAATELQINETELKIVQLTKELQREVAKELGEVQASLFELREKIQSLENTVARTVVRAPEPGMVLGLSVHTLGGVIEPGGKILDIVPKGEALIVEAKVSPQDIDRIHAGQRAEVRFSAFKSRETPKIEGKLVTVSADRLVDPHDPNQMPYYLARVAITPEGLKELARQKLDLVPGMPAEVLINTGSRTLFQYLVDPFVNTVARSLIED